MARDCQEKRRGNHRSAGASGLSVLVPLTPVLNGLKQSHQEGGLDIYPNSSVVSIAQATLHSISQLHLMRRLRDKSHSHFTDIWTNIQNSVLLFQYHINYKWQTSTLSLAFAWVKAPDLMKRCSMSSVKSS
jgi:hypothetical protein